MSDTPETAEEILQALYNYGYNNGRVAMIKAPEVPLAEAIATINALRRADIDAIIGTDTAEGDVTDLVIRESLRIEQRKRMEERING